MKSPPFSDPPKDLGEPDLGEVYLEMTVIGGTLKVSAIHVETGIEVSSMAPANAARADLPNAQRRALLTVPLLAVTLGLPDGGRVLQRLSGAEDVHPRARLRARQHAIHRVHRRLVGAVRGSLTDGEEEHREQHHARHEHEEGREPMAREMASAY